MRGRSRLLIKIRRIKVKVEKEKGKREKNQRNRIKKNVEKELLWYKKRKTKYTKVIHEKVY